MSLRPSTSDHLPAFVDWIVERALPVWAEKGLDAEAGRFRERLDGSGQAIAIPHRSMVQARQIYVYAHAAELGWFSDGGAMADRAMAMLLRDFCEEGSESAAFAFSIDPGGGGIVSSVGDAYAHAFVLFSLAALYRVTGAARLLEVADKTIRYLDDALTDPVNGGLFDAAPVTVREKRQNPHMHLLEAYLFLEHAAPGRGYAERAGALVRLFRERLLRRPPGVLLEYFAEDWSPHPDAARRGLWEPGHHFEWVWLLTRYTELTGDDAGDLAVELHDVASRHGIAPDGMIHDELGLDMVVTKPSHRVWPHSEAIKAAVVRHDAGDTRALPLANAMAGALLDTFLDRPFAGGWIDHVALDGTPLVDYAPASTLYHLFLAAAEAAPLARAAPATR